MSLLRDAQDLVDETVTDQAVLESAAGWSAGGRFPTDSLAGRFPGIPKGEFVRRQRQLEQKGWLSGWILTPAGLTALREA